ncbi:MAG: PAS domain-containing protein [bacterium]|nr:PAS domain-containing protein [bacterium]
MRLRHRFLAYLCVAALLGVLLVAVASVGVLRVTVRERVAERVRIEAALLSQWVESAGEGLDPQALAVQAARELELRTTLIDERGIVLGDSARERDDVALMENHLERPEIAGARASGRGDSYRRSDTTSATYFYAAHAVPAGGPVRYVRVALPEAELRRLQDSSTPSIVLATLATMVLLVALSYVLVLRFSRPIEALSNSVRRIVSEDRRAELPYAHVREVDRLRDAVDTLRRDLIEELSALEAEDALLTSVFSGMREAVLLVGRDRRVRLANDALRETLGIDGDPRGQMLEEVVRHPTILSHVEQVFAAGHEARGEQPLRFAEVDRAFEIRGTPLRRSDDDAVDSVLVLLLDVTRLETLESMRRDFVANVSHELRTPLTSIKAFVENLLEGDIDDPATSRRFLEIILKHADRMGDLVEDLTDLSSIETGSISLNVDAVDVHSLGRECFDQLQPLARARSIELCLELPAGFRVRADRRRLHQMLANLLDNAIKFGREGGRVALFGRFDGEWVEIGVEDDGIGIGEADRERVFHRFYQVSRERSPAVRGTGLGLAIVKHLMRLHGGRVEIESEPGHGSRFVLVFPGR